MTAPAVEVRGLCKSFGATSILRDVNLSVPRGARHALVGPNGAGKTSLFKVITGLYRPTSGTLRLDGEDVTALSQVARKQRGVTRSFRLSRQARELTVLDNLRLAVGGCTCVGAAHAAGKREHVDLALDQLEQLALLADARKPVRELPASRQRLVEIAIALAQRPKLLLLDEPADGVPSPEIHLILDVIRRLDRDVTVVIIEHNLDLVLRIADRVTVLAAGAVLMEGTGEEIAARQQQAERTLSQFSLATLVTMNQIIAQRSLHGQEEAAQAVTPAVSPPAVCPPAVLAPNADAGISEPSGSSRFSAEVRCQRC
jgi:branched-chain amino acid transport system ATP-binding protein